MLNPKRNYLGVRNSAYLRDLLIEISKVDISFDSDTCIWSLVNDGRFSVGLTRHHIDDKIFPSLDIPISWDKALPRKMSDNTTRAQCIHCFNFLSALSNSTLRKHFTHPHCEALKTVPEPRQQFMGRDESVFVYNPDYLHEEFAGLVIQQGLPFNHFDHEQTTRVFQNTVQPKCNHVIAFEDFSVPHTGSRLARMLRNTFIAFNLEEKVLSIKLDNASNNTNAISKLKLKYDPPMEGRFYHSQCVEHIINLVVQEELLIESISTDLEFLDDVHTTSTKQWFNESLAGLYNLYYMKYGNPTTQSASGGSSSRASGGNQISNLLHRLKEHKNKKERSDSSLSFEYERYIHSDLSHIFKPVTLQVLISWVFGNQRNQCSSLSRMSIDVLGVQATSVASKSAFSTSGRVLLIRRTRLTQSFLEMCMCLKDHLDTQERKQDTSTLENTIDFEDGVLDAKVQENEATSLFDEEIALDADGQGAVASGSEGVSLTF
nr:zinc finger BED domain-containing protein RICESLEEPER 2 [Tanacetum cinerariifolium]